MKKGGDILSKNKKEPMNHNRIKEVRLEKHKTQKDLAKLLNVSEQAISYYEKALREPSLKSWVKLADYLGVSISYLQGVDDSFSKDEARVHDMTSGLYYDLSRSLLNDVPKEVANRMIKQESKIPNESLETFAAMNLMFYSLFLEASTGENDYSEKYLDIIIQALNEYGNRDSKTN